MAAGLISRDEDVRRAYAADVSGLVREPEGVARPTSADEVAAVVRECAAAAVAITPAGGQTSTTAASITDRGIVLSTRAMARIVDVDPVARSARVEPGVVLGDLDRALAPHGLFFPPDPTSDQECTVGGAIACNASGPRTLAYGATRAHVTGVEVVLADGTRFTARRPRLEKNAVGYHAAQDPVDWFVGSEGTLGVVVAAELALAPRPAVEVGLAIPFLTEVDALTFVVAARDSSAVRARCLEYLDAEAFAIARAGALPGDSWAAGAGAMVYAEEAGEDAPPLDAWLALAEAHGARDHDVRVFQGGAAIREARRLRHAIPAAVNERQAAHRAAGGRKVSTDWAVPYRALPAFVARTRSLCAQAGIPTPITFGHAGNGHPHQNFIGRDAAEVARFEAVVEAILREAVALGGTVAAEHGIGKLKARWLALQLAAPQRAVLRAIKQALDPQGLFAPGNLFG